MFEHTSINEQTGIKTGTGYDMPESWGQIFQAQHAMYAHVQNTSGIRDIENEMFAERDAEVIKHIKATQDRSWADTMLNLDRYDRGDKDSLKSLIPLATQDSLARQRTERDIQEVISANEGMFKTDDQIREAATAKVRQIYDESTDILSRSDSWTAEVAGGFTGMMTDPMHQIGLLLGGKAALGRSLISKMATMGTQEATAAIVTESFVQPEVYKTMDRIGIDYSYKDALAAIGIAGAGGFILGGALQGMGSVITRNFSDAEDVLKAASSKRQDMWRDIETGRLKKTDQVMASYWEAEQLDLTINSLVQVTGKKAPATEVVSKLFELKAAELQISRIIAGTQNKFDAHVAYWQQSLIDDAVYELSKGQFDRISKQLGMIKDWQKGLESDTKYELTPSSLERLQKQLDSAENNPRDYFKWQESDSPVSARQKKKNEKTGYTEPKPKKLNREQKAEREALVKGMQGALDRHKKAVDAKKKLANYDSNIIPEEVRARVDSESGLTLGDTLPTKAELDAPLIEPVRARTEVDIEETIQQAPAPKVDKAAASARIASAQMDAITPPMKAPLPTDAKARIADDILDEDTLSHDKVLFDAVNDINDYELPVSIKVVDGEEVVEIKKASEIMGALEKRQEGFEKIQMCMRGSK